MIINEHILSFEVFIAHNPNTDYIVDLIQHTHTLYTHFVHFLKRSFAVHRKTSEIACNDPSPSCSPQKPRVWHTKAKRKKNWGERASCSTENISWAERLPSNKNANSFAVSNYKQCFSGRKVWGGKGPFCATLFCENFYVRYMPRHNVKCTLKPLCYSSHSLLCPFRQTRIGVKTNDANNTGNHMVKIKRLHNENWP